TPPSLLATPAASVWAVPRMVPLSRKVTVPEGTPVLAFTWATSVELPAVGSICWDSETTEPRTFAGAGPTVIVAGADVLPANGPFALKLAEMVCAPGLREAVLKAAVPLAESPRVRRTTLPS